MHLPDGYHDLAPGKLANVAIYLEMTHEPERQPWPDPAPWHLERFQAEGVARYRDLFHRVGDAYLWSSRMVASDAEIAAILADARVEAFALRSDGHDGGLLELDFREAGACELRYFGLTAPLIGSGAARWLIAQAIVRAWSQPIARFWLHTCTLDHPRALAFYQRAGFRPYKRAIEIYDDPRATGIVPAGAAPGVPLLP